MQTLLLSLICLELALLPVAFSYSHMVQSPPSSRVAMVDGDVQRSRTLDTKGLDSQPQKQLWKLEKLFKIVQSAFIVGSSGPIRFYVDVPTHQAYSSPIISEGVLFFTLYIDDAYFYAIDANNGKQLVTLRFDRNRLSAPAILGHTAFFGSQVGRVTAYDVDSRKAKWIIENRGHSFSYSDPVLEDDTLYICGANVGLFALKTESGDVKWVFKSDEILRGPSIRGDDVVLASSSGLLMVLNKKTGAKKWEVRMGREFSIPAILDDQILVSHRDGEVRAYAIRDGALRWKFNKEGGAWTELALFKNTIFYGERYGNILALNADTGSEKWRFKTNRPCREPIIASNTVYASCDDKYLYALDVQTGSEKWKWEHKKTEPPFPTFAGGIMYLLGDDGLLSASK